MTSIEGIFRFLIGIIDKLIYLVIGVALLAFIWGVFNYLRNYNNEKERKASVNYIIYGPILVFINLAFSCTGLSPCIAALSRAFH